MNRIWLMIVLLLVDICTILYVRKKYNRYNLKLALQHVLSVAVILASSCCISNEKQILISLLLSVILSFFSVNQIVMGFTSVKYYHRYNLLEMFLNILWIMFWLGITTDIVVAIVIAEITYLLLGYVSYYVFNLRGTEFEWGDIQAISTAKTVVCKYKIKVNGIVLAGGISQALHLYIICLLLTERREVNIYGHMRIVIFIFIFFSGYLLIFTGWLKKIGIVYTAIQNSKGVAVNLLLQLIDGRREKESEDKKSEDLEELQNYPEIEFSVKKTIWKYPNILVIMNESFSDLRMLEKKDDYKGSYKKIDELIEEGMKQGIAYTSVFGGNTAFSEFEFLTGNSSRFYSGCPYSARTIKNGVMCNSFVSYLKQQGYTTLATHPYNRGNWRRPIVYSAFGFDKQLYYEDFGTLNMLRNYASDKSYYRRLAELYRSKPKNEKYFSFNITIQNHGGYENTEKMCLENFFDMQDVNLYLNLVSESGKALSELIKYFSEFKEPMAILFFGDHQPKFCDEYYKKVLGKNRQNMTDKEQAILYMTPWYIWTNYDCEIVSDEIMSLNYLFEYFFQVVGIPRNRYGLYLDGLKKKFPVITKQFVMNKKLEIIGEDSQKEIITYRNIAREYLYGSNTQI